MNPNPFIGNQQPASQGPAQAFIHQMEWPRKPLGKGGPGKASHGMAKGGKSKGGKNKRKGY